MDNVNFAQDRDIQISKSLMIYLQNMIQNFIAGLVESGQKDMPTDYFILSGVELAGGNYSDGWVSINGELLPFVGGPTQTTVIIVDIVTQESWEDSTGTQIMRDTYHTRHVEFGIGAGQINFSDLIRLQLARSRQNITGGYSYLGSAAITPAADWAFDVNGAKSIIHKDQFNRVHIYGLIQYTGVDCGATGQLIATLASDYKPTVPFGLTEQYKIFIDTTTYPPKILVVEINITSGQITAFNGDQTHNAYYLIDFDYISE